MLGCLPLAIIFGIVGIAVDQSKALAITMTVLALAVCAICFGGALLNC